MISNLGSIAKRVKYLIALVLIFAMTGLNSCKKVLDIKSTRLSDETTQWKKIEDAKSGLMGVYGLMRTAMSADNLHWLMGDLREGDFASYSRPDLKAIANGQLNASYPIFSKITNWRRFYAVINAASLFIERSGEILTLDPRYTKNNNDVDIAQARALRAFAYFYMARIWGDVPLLTSSHDGNFEQYPRTSKEKVLAFATSELLLTVNVLPYRYGGTDPAQPGLYFGATWMGLLFNKISAYAILAHIAAWEQNYIDAEIYTKFIVDNYNNINTDEATFGIRYIDMNGLTENDDPTSPFRTYRGTIVVGFTYTVDNGEATVNGHIEDLTLATPLISKANPEIYVPKDTIRKVFTDPLDLRFGIDPATNLYRTNYFLNYSSARPMFSKIKVIRSANFALFSSTALFTRLEELTLLRAEALAVLGQRDEAIENLNRATNLRGVTPFTSASNKDIIDAIFQERRRELMGEGWRWYDQVRYNKIKRNNKAFNALIDNNGIYWPVAQDVITKNPKIVQNPYWK